GLQAFSVAQLTPMLYRSLLQSLLLAGCSGLLAVILSMMLIWSNRLFTFYQHTAFVRLINIISLLMLILPAMVLAGGLFLLFFPLLDLLWFKVLLLICCNALMAMPFVIKTLEPPMQDITGNYQLLLQSLNINGLTRLKLIEL